MDSIDLTDVLFLVLTVSSLAAWLVYGLLTPWYKGWTGRGLFMLLTAMAMLTGLYSARMLTPTFWLERELSGAAYVILIVAINVGITGNIIIQQFSNRKRKR